MTGNRVRFAIEEFIFDPETGELMHNGLRVRINRQIADLLLLLLENAGQLVTRDQIRDALWPQRELLNHEKIITNGISRLRFLLNDSPTESRYIESIPKRGYRLVAEVRRLEPDTYTSPAQITVSQSVLTADAETETLTATALSHTGADSLSSAETASAISAARLRRGWSPYLWLSGAVVVLLIGVFFYRRSSHENVIPPKILSVGIAPFDTEGPGAEDLAGSFRLELADSLSELPQVRILATSSLRLLKMNQATFRDELPKLGLDAILYGRFVVKGEDCHLELELVRGKDGSHMATFQYTGTRDQLASIRDSIQRDTFSRLELNLDDKVGKATPPGGTADPEAYELYLRARYHLSLQTSDSLRMALDEYKAAEHQDPKFAKAYAGEANTYIFLWQHHIITEQESFQLATAAVQKALSFDNSSADAHGVLGVIHLQHDWDLQSAEQELRQSLTLDPNQPIFHQWLAAVLCDEGRFAESFQQIDEAHAEDPLWASAYITEDLVATEGHDHTRMVSASNRLIELMPESPHVRDVLGNVAWVDGRYSEAITTWRSMAVLEGDTDRIHLEDRGLEALREGGVHAYAEVRLQAIESGKGLGKHPNDFDPSEWYAAAGEKEKALAAIRQNIAAHDPNVMQMAVHPAYDSLHDDPEFLAILHQLHLSLPAHEPLHPRGGD